jgi:hypothetical protein
MTEIAAAGDFTANANCTDITTKIPIARMACNIAKISTPSCCSELLVRRALDQGREMPHVTGTCRSSDVQTDGI